MISQPLRDRVNDELDNRSADSRDEHAPADQYEGLMPGHPSIPKAETGHRKRPAGRCARSPPTVAWCCRAADAVCAIAKVAQCTSSRRM
jgi:hypothetical protein